MRFPPSLPPAANPRGPAGTLPRRPAVFLDRDGTLNREKGYVHTWDAWEWLPGVPQGLAALRAAGYALVVVSNQSGVARGYYGEDAVRALHARVNADLARFGFALDAMYHCPHHPDFTGACGCRKPAPGMLLRAARELRLDLARSWMVGDKLDDIQAGLRAGCRALLVRTGHGAAQGAMPAGVAICPDFTAAARHILAAAPGGFPPPARS